LPFVRNANFCDALVKAETDFWRRVQDRDPPEPDGSASTIAALNALYPRDSGETVELSSEALLWDAQIQAAKETRKETESVINLCEARIKDAIGDATYGELPDGTVYSWKTQRRKAYSVEAKEFRVLRRKATK